MKQTFLRHALWAALLAAGAAMAQDAAISGADFTHGKADAQFAAIGAKAAADGQTVVVTAPTYWQAKVAAKIRAGSHGKPVAIRFSNGFYENVLVRTEAAAPVEAAKPEVKTAPKAEAKAEPRAKSEPEARVAKAEPKPATEAAAKHAPQPVAAPAPKPAVVTVPAPKAAEVAQAAPRVQAPVRQVPASVPPQSAPQVASNIVAVPQVSQQPAVVPIPTTAINATGAQSVMPAAAPRSDTAVRQRMLASLNNGRPAMGSLTEGELQPGDHVYADGDTLAVVRLEGLQRDLYWLQGPVDLQRVQYMPQAEGSYQVMGTIDPKSPATHRRDGGAHKVVASSIPATGSATRVQLEQRYNNGQPITGTLTIARLLPEDRLMVDGGSVIVARREGNSMARYWLSGSIDLGQSGLQKVDANVYRVIGNSLH
jgi:hypothetical protein